MFSEKGQRGGEFPESSFCFTLDTVPVYEFEIFLIGNVKQLEILGIWWLDCSIRARPHHNSGLPVLPRLVVQSLSHVQLFVTPWTVAHQALLSMGFQARVLEWVAISFSRGSSWPRDQTCISCTGGRFFTTEPPGKPCYPCWVSIKPGWARHPQKVCGIWCAQP